MTPPYLILFHQLLKFKGKNIYLDLFEREGQDQILILQKKFTVHLHFNMIHTSGKGNYTFSVLGSQMQAVIFPANSQTLFAGNA